MKSVDFLIVGGSAAGTTAAEVIRGLTPNASVCIVSDEPYEEYSKVLAPHYARHKVAREQVFLKKPQWYNEKKISLLKGVRAEKLDSTKKSVALSNGEVIQYGKLLIAIGGYVVPLSVPGAESANILYLRTIDDADKIIEKTRGAKSAVVVGGGFIGLEFCSCFKLNGVEDITVLVREPYYWAGKLDEVSSRVLVGVLEKEGIKIVTGEEVERIENGQVMTIKGNKYDADVIGVGIGINPDLGWLSGSGVKIDRGVLTNEYLETNVADIYAAGDCAQFWDAVFERQHLVGNWANATAQGSAVGKTMSGEMTKFETASSYSINFFSGTCSFIGVCDEKFADKVIMRGSEVEKKVTRIFVKNYPGIMRVVGATVVNYPADVALLTMAVKNKINVASKVAQLEKADLKGLAA